MKLRFSGLLALALLLSGVGAAANAAGEAAANSLAREATNQLAASSEARDGVVISMQLSSEAAVPSQLYGSLELRNTNSNRKLIIKSLVVRPVGRLGGVYGSADIWKGPEQTVEVQSSKPFRVVFSVVRPPSLFEHVAFKSGANDFLATLTYYFDDQAMAKTSEFLVAPVVTTSTIYVFFGGLFGALLLIAFIVTSKFLVEARAGRLLELMPRLGPLSAKWFLLSLAYAINGFVVAVLLVLLSAGLNTFEIPISFKLQDFGGGLIVGLFSVTLGKFLAEKLALTP